MIYWTEEILWNSWLTQRKTSVGKTAVYYKAKRRIYLFGQK